jgi:hypothetical protein
MLQTFIARAACSLEGVNLAFGVVATNVELDMLYRSTAQTFSEAMKEASHLISDDFLELVRRNKDLLDKMVIHSRDESLG